MARPKKICKPIVSTDDVVGQNNNDELVDEISFDDIISAKLLASFDMLVPIHGAPISGVRTFQKGEIIRDKATIKMLIMNDAPVEIEH
jgi:hypothetical protein